MEQTQPYVLCKVSVNAIIVRGRKILLLQLARPKHKRGLWSLPGGKVDQGESFDQALQREILEETGIKPSEYE